MAVYTIGSRYLVFSPTGPITWSTAAPAVPRVIVSIGESNSGGQGLVSVLPAPLKAETSRVKILMTATGTFENLHIGVNNNVSHVGLDASYHAWEAGLLPYLDANPGQSEPMYLVQCGQGGSSIYEWENGDYYWTQAQSRINAAKAAFVTLGITPVWELWFTLGINDFISVSPPSVAAYKAACITMLGEFRAMIGNGTATRIRSPEFMATIKSAYPTYCAAHEELATDVINLQIIDTTGLPQDDDYHWSSAGQVSLGQLMAAA